MSSAKISIFKAIVVLKRQCAFYKGPCFTDESAVGNDVLASSFFFSSAQHRCCSADSSVLPFLYYYYYYFMIAVSARQSVLDISPIPLQQLSLFSSFFFIFYFCLLISFYFVAATFFYELSAGLYDMGCLFTPFF